VTGLALVLGAAVPSPGWAEEPVYGLSPSTDGYEARALIQADAEVTLSSEIPGRIIELSLREGDRFKKGQTLLRFDCRAHEGRLRMAQAALKAARLKLDNQKKRVELDAAGALEVGLAEAEVERALGDVETTGFSVDRCHIRAPFDGRLVALATHRHETVAVGAPLMRILDDSRMEIKIVVPSQWLSWLIPGARFEMRVDETGGIVEGEVARVGAVVDAVSQSVPVFSVLSAPGDDLVSGMSGIARFTGPPTGNSQ